MRRGRQGLQALPLRAMYALGELARAASMDRRTLHRMLANAGVELHTVGRVTFVGINELAEKASPLWEAIQTVQRFAVGRGELPP